MLNPRAGSRAVDASFDSVGRLNVTVGAGESAVGSPGYAVAIEQARPVAMAPAIGPSTAGLVTVAVLAGLAVFGALLTARRRMDPALRAEATLFDRAGLTSADRRSLRRAARRLEPPVPAASLLLAEALIDQAVEATPPASPDAGRLSAIARRQFGEGQRSEPTVARDVDAIRPRRPAVPPMPAEDAHRTRAASRLAIALEIAALRRPSFDGGSPRRG